MEAWAVAASSAVSAAVAGIGTRLWIRAAARMGFKSRDMNKPGEVYAVDAGGVWVVVGAAFGLMALIALEVYTGPPGSLVEEGFALASLLLLSGFLGFLDDIMGWKRGLPVWSRVALMAPISVPLVVIKAGHSMMELPFVGVVDLGYAYPLLLVPLGVVGASNAFNMLAGYNGLEAGMGLALMAFTAVFTYAKGIHEVTAFSLVMAASLAAFLAYNWYPARVFPGNSMTYGVGAYYAGLVILGNFEKFGVTLFALYFVELALFLRGLKDGVYKENFGLPKPDGSLDPPYPKSYSLTHVAIRVLAATMGRATERGVVAFILLLQALVGAASLLAYA